MLVHLKDSMCCTTLDGYRIYGKKYAYGSFGPTNIPLKVWNNHKDILEEAEYNSKWLENKFGGKFPDISFKVSKLYNIDIRVLIQIAHLIGIRFHKSRRTTVTEKRALCRAVKKKIVEEV